MMMPGLVRENHIEMTDGDGSHSIPGEFYNPLYFIMCYFKIATTMKT